LLAAKLVAVSGWSMAPTLMPEERVLVNRLAYRRSEPKRGDVVLARDPRDVQRLLIKRVVGLPGETVEATEGELSVNGEVITHIGESAQPGNPNRGAGQIWRLGTDEYFLVGDAAELVGDASTDSRTFGPVHLRLLVGRVWAVVWPPEKARRVR
jgi:signal peptidase I